MARRKKYNPEKRAWRRKSYKRAGKLIARLKQKEKERLDSKQELE
jgi:hypothetical protein